MGARGYVGTYRGNVVPFYVPARFLAQFRARLGRIVREARPEDGESDRIVPLISTRKVAPIVEAPATEPEPEQVEQPKRGRRGVRAGT